MLRNLCMSNQREQSISHMKAVHAYDIIKANLTNNRNLYVWMTLYLSSYTKVNVCTRTCTYRQYPTHPPVISTSWPSHVNSPLTRNRNIAKATTTMMKEGTMNDHPQGSLTSSQSAQNEGMIVPRMLPTEVWEFQIPMIRPRLRGVVCVCA